MRPCSSAHCVRSAGGGVCFIQQGTLGAFFDHRSRWSTSSHAGYLVVVPFDCSVQSSSYVLLTASPPSTSSATSRPRAAHIPVSLASPSATGVLCAPSCSQCDSYGGVPAWPGVPCTALCASSRSAAYQPTDAGAF